MNRRLLAVIILAGAMLGSILYYALPKKREDIVKNYENIIQDCISLCMRAKSEGIDLSPGPCLTDVYPWDHKGWVCDVAHWPREKIDNLKENQCKNWWIEARNFIEVDPNCRPIRIFVYGKTKEPVVIQ